MKFLTNVCPLCYKELQEMPELQFAENSIIGEGIPSRYLHSSLGTYYYLLPQTRYAVKVTFGLIQYGWKSEALPHVGPDWIHPRVPRELTEVLTKPLSIIYQHSWLTGDVLVDWRLANVIYTYSTTR